MLIGSYVSSQSLNMIQTTSQHPGRFARSLLYHFPDDEKEQQHRQHAQRQKRHHSNTKAIPNSVIPRHPKPDARNTETGSETPVTHGSSQYYSRVPQERMESRHLPHPVEWENAPRPTNLHFRPFPPFTCGLRPTFTEMPPPRFGGSPFNHRSFTSHEPRRTMPLPPLRNEFFRVPGPAIPPPFLPLSDLYPQPCLQDVPREPSFQDTLVALKPGLISQEATKVTDSEVKDCAPLVTSPKLLPEAHSLFYDPKTAHALSEVRPRFPPKGFMGIWRVVVWITCACFLFSWIKYKVREGKYSGSACFPSCFTLVKEYHSSLNSKYGL